MVMTVALSTTNPFYLAIVLLSILLVAVLAPRTATAIAGFRALLVLGSGLMVLSIGIAAINAPGGDHLVFTLPSPAFPSWLGGLRLGGPVTWEAMAAATIRGLAILGVFLAFAVFNGAVSPHRVLRMTPAALFHAGLIVTVGLTLLPSTIEDLRRIREAQALRGHPSGLRGVPALVVPAVTGGLERSFRLAEAMEARGYASAPPAPPIARLMGTLSAPLVLAAALAWFYAGSLRWLALPLVAGAILGLAGWGWLSARRRATTSLHSDTIGRLDAVAAGASLAMALLVFAGRSAGWFNLGYNPFAGLPVPAFHPLEAALALACAWPAARLALIPSSLTAEQPALSPGSLNA
jgi:energy-coupling factor transport system permease protein